MTREPLPPLHRGHVAGWPVRAILVTALVTVVATSFILWSAVMLFPFPCVSP